MAKENKDMVVGLDIGTATVRVVVAEVTKEEGLKLIGLGSAPTKHGLKNGVVVNINATVQSIQSALKEAEMMAKGKITRVYVGITGNHIQGINSSSTVPIKEGEVSVQDVSRVIETARAIVPITSDRRFLLVEPQEFKVDGQEVREPVNMSGVRLETKIHIVTGANSTVENIIKCVRRCGLEVEDFVLNSMASSAAVLTKDEKDLGVVLIDIGAGTTDVAIFVDGVIQHTAVLPLAGDLITSDIAMALHTPIKDAEEVKLEYGWAKQLLVDPTAQVEIPGLGDREPRMLSRQTLAEVIEARLAETFGFVRKAVQESGYEDLISSGVVLTGATAVMPGIVELAEDIFSKPVRRGSPLYQGDLADMVRHPQAATVIGLVKKGEMHKLSNMRQAASRNILQDVLGGMKRFLGVF